VIKAEDIQITPNKPQYLDKAIQFARDAYAIQHKDDAGTVPELGK